MYVVYDVMVEGEYSVLGSVGVGFKFKVRLLETGINGSMLVLPVLETVGALRAVYLGDLGRNLAQSAR